MPAGYDTIGLTYSARRRADPRIAARIDAALGDARTVLNVGAGTGNYEPASREVTALEPSAEMIAQRPADAARVVRGSAENLPFENASFDAAMAVLTIHHWTDSARGLAEMRRVSRGRVVLLTYDPAFRDFWLFDYFPALTALDDRVMPPLDYYRAQLGPVRIDPVPIPADCHDGFLCAFWQRPEAYLDREVRAGMSSFWKIGDLSDGLARLFADLDSGAWEARHGHLRNIAERDCGYRLVVAA